MFKPLFSMLVFRGTDAPRLLQTNPVPEWRFRADKGRNLRIGQEQNRILGGENLPTAPRRN
jgi:hypothetical protein